LLEEMVRGLGAAVRAVEAAFDPEPGSDYGHEHAHHHAHGRAHD
jgi:urease accessory protein UreE